MARLDTYGHAPVIAIGIELVFALGCVFAYLKSEARQGRPLTRTRSVALYTVFTVGILAWLPATTMSLGTDDRVAQSTERRAPARRPLWSESYGLGGLRHTGEHAVRFMLEAVSEALEPDHLGAVMILTFVIIFIVASAWDVRHVNRVLGTMVNPGGKQTYYR